MSKVGAASGPRTRGLWTARSGPDIPLHPSGTRARAYLQPSYLTSGVKNPGLYRTRGPYKAEMNRSFCTKHGARFSTRMQLRSPTGTRGSRFDELSGAFAGPAVPGGVRKRQRPWVSGGRAEGKGGLSSGRAGGAAAEAAAFQGDIPD